MAKEPVLSPSEWPSLQGRHVPPDGPWGAKIVAIGESPWTYENATGKPFSGPSGNQLNSFLLQAGLSRPQLLVYNWWPIYNGKKPATLTIPEREFWCQSLRQWLSSLPNVRVVVPMGSFACYALTGRGGEDIKGIAQDKKIGIDSLRGSLYDWVDANGRTIRVIPTLHPAHILRGGQGKIRRVVRDWQRIAREAEEFTPEPAWSCTIHPTSADLQRLWTLAQCEHTVCAIDVECPDRKLTCVGFAPSKDWACVLPLYSKDLRDAYLPWVQALAASPCQKVLQNGLFDAYWLERECGVRMENYAWDLMDMHHACHPREQQSLSFLSSWFAPFHRFWKDENKIDWSDKDSSFRDKMEQHLLYNGKDCVVERELYDYLSAELDAFEMRDFYLQHYRPLYYPLLDMMLAGVQVDRERLLSYKRMAKASIEDMRADLEHLAGEDLWARKKPSRDKLMKFFYETLGLPKQTKITKMKSGEKERRDTLDATALLKLAQKHPQAAAPAKIVIQLEHTVKELATWFDEKALDSDDRVRCSYSLNTEAGRFKSSGNPMGTGYNLQNVKRPLRDMYVPPKGWVFLKPDLSAAEDRVVKMIAAEAIRVQAGGSPDRMVHMANRRPWEADAHKEAATFAFGCTVDKVDKAMRQTAKVVSHGSQRGMSGQKLSDKLLLDFDILHTPAQCQKMVDKYLEALWEIRDGYFPFIRASLIKNGSLTNNWGRVWRIENQPFDADLFRKAYSFNPQSDVRDLMSQWGILPLVGQQRDGWLYQTGKHSQLLADMHDGLLIACPPEEVWDISNFLVASLERPRLYYGRPLVIPVTLTISTTWKGGVEFDRLPTREEMEHTIGQLLGGAS